MAGDKKRTYDLNPPLFFPWRGMTLFQGAPYALFKEMWNDDLGRTDVPLHEAVQLINEQTEIIEEALNQQMTKPEERRQVVLYMIEQCILICAMLPCRRSCDRIRFRKARRILERARRIIRGDGL